MDHPRGRRRLPGGFRRSLAALLVLTGVTAACASAERPTLVPVPTGPSLPGATAGGTTAAPDPACAAVPIGVHEVVLDAGGAARNVRVSVPATFTGARVPVVIGWHGLGSDGLAQAQLTGFETLAEAEGFVTVHPTGVPNAGDSRAAWQLVTSPPDPSHDDVAFARALVDDVIANWCADPRRIYMTGMSNGGFFTARLVCELGDRIAAALSVGGLSFPDTCVPARPVPYLAFHGTLDEFVPYTGNGQSVLVGSGDLPAELFTSSIPAEFAQFATVAGCDPTTSDTPFGTTMIRRTYTGCDGGAALSLVEMVNGGHVWPRAPEWPLDATVDGWAFLRQFALP